MSLFTELKRRNVFRVAAAYVVTAWLVIQVVETILPAFGYGDAAVRYVTIALAVGLIPVLVLSWVFEWTPEGIRREAEVGDLASASLKAAKRFDQMILVGLAVALGYFAFDKFVLEPQREAEQAVQQQAEIEEAREEGRSEALVESYGDKSIAVLPFRDMSPKGDQEYFSEGIAEELLNLLARVPNLRVTSRTSSFAFKGQSLEVPEIARRLKVGHVLEGSVRKAGNTVRITAQLIDARSDTHLWSQTWDRKLTNILAIQDEIAAAVVESLQSVMLGPARSDSAKQMPEAGLEAYDLVLKGRYLLNQGNVDAYQRALPLYERAIDLAPDYAPAHAGLAKVLRQMTAFNALDAEAVGARIEMELHQALQLDPNDPDALTTKGMWLATPTAGFDEAREYWRKAVSINPNDGDALRWLGWSYMNVDSVRYLEYMERAYGVAPTNTMVVLNLAGALSRFERVDQLFGVLQDWHTLSPQSPLPAGIAGDSFYRDRQFEQALKCYYQAFRTAPDSAESAVSGLVWLQLDGLSLADPELALEWVDWHIAHDPNAGISLFQKTIILWISGRQEEARHNALEMSEQHPEWGIAHARSHLLVTRDYRRSRELWESFGMSDSNLEMWDTFTIVDYAYVLQQTGDLDRARALVVENLARIEQQMAAGVRIENWWELKFYAAVLYTLRGEKRKALDYLQEDAANGGLSSVVALKVWPHFDGLRDDPEFQALIAEQDEINARRYRRLEEEGLLLGPEEVLALNAVDCEPFADP